MSYPVIALFTYNRPQHLKKTFQALKLNLESKKFHLKIYSDGPKTKFDQKNVHEVRKVIKNFKGFCSIEFLFNEKNLGLYNSIIRGLDLLFQSYEKVIVIEDDVVVNKFFLKYMENSLNFYKNSKVIHSITGYSFLKKKPTFLKSDHYLSIRHSSWAWGTWRHVWEKIDWNKKNIIKKMINFKDFKNKFNQGGHDMNHILTEQLKGNIQSWSIIFDFNCFINNGYCLCPSYSMVKNIGFDGTGTHCDENTNSLNNKIYKNFTIKSFDKDIQPNEKVLQYIKNTLESSRNLNSIQYIFAKIKKLLKFFNY